MGDEAVRALAVDGPWDTTAALALLVAHTIPGAETTTLAGDGSGVHRRLLRLDGELVAVEVRVGAGGAGSVHDGAPGGEVPPVAVVCAPRHLDAAEQVVRRWFELDVAQQARNELFAADPVLGPLVARRPGLRVTGHPEPFEALLGIVVGQQISLAAARTVTARLVAGFGTPGPAGLTAFPTPGQLAGSSVDELRAACGFMASRARTVLTVARAAVDGLDLQPGQGAEQLAQTRRELLALPGIGPWTVDFLCLRALRDPDSFPAGDLVLQKALGLTKDADARRVAERWAPHRSFAALHLWTEAAYLA